MTFGLKTNTGDLDGKVLQEDNFVPTKKDFNSILKKFVGNIYQEAPLFSSLKYKGKPMYQYARKGMNIPSKSCINNIKSSLVEYFIITMIKS